MILSNKVYTILPLLISNELSSEIMSYLSYYYILYENIRIYFF